MADGAGRLSVRAQAARLYRRVLTRGATLESMLDEDHGLSARDLRLLRALVAGALRWHWRLDRLLAELSTRPVAALDPTLAALLRIGLFQLAGTRIPDHAGVSATVDACPELGFEHARGLVNAVLRRYLREREQLEQTLDDDEVARFSHPAWLIDAIRADWPSEWRAVLAANNEQPPMWLRVNQRRAPRAAYLAELAAAGHDAVASERVGTAVLLSEPCPADRLPGYAEGRVSIQDGAAQLAAGLMDLAPGQRVLDACAAPGGKTAHILEACTGLGAVVALDRDRARLDLVARNLARLALDATLVHADAMRVDEWWDGDPFDRVLLDAPCSATGVIRRHPEIKALRRPADVDPLVETQAGLLAALWPLVKPGGLLLYATCSVLERENQAQVRRFLAAHGDAICPELGSPGHFRIRPGEANLDGFYYACLRKAQDGG